MAKNKKKMNLNYEARKILGDEKWNELVKKYNLCTKKWSYGRSKNFYEEAIHLIDLKAQKLADENQKFAKKYNGI